jgi:hypothetical protein
MTTTLQQFRNEHKDLTGVREGWDRYPSSTEAAEIERVALASGVVPSALQDIFLCYSNNEFDINSLPAWLEINKLTRPHLWPGVGIYALIQKAFCGPLDLKARADLIETVGEVQADAYAIQCGLASAKDFKTKGKAPEGAEASLNGDIHRLEVEVAAKQAELAKAKSALPADKPSTNPFFAGAPDPKWLEAALKGMGTKAVAALARSARSKQAPFGRTIDGRPLRA